VAKWDGFRIQLFKDGSDVRFFFEGAEYSDAC
jgi:hypothetical protein